jgi:hypothetical protein
MVSQNYISLEAVQDFINNKQEDEENEFADMRLLCAKNEKECEISSSHGGEYDVQSCLLHGSTTQKTALNEKEP